VIPNKKNIYKKFENDNKTQKEYIQKLENELKELKKGTKSETTVKTEPIKTRESKVENKNETKSDYKNEPSLGTPQETKAVRKSSAARPSAIPGAAAGKPAPEDWLVKVNIVKGIGLRNAAIFGQIDPFVEVTVQGATSLSKTVQQTQNPEWNSKLNFFGDAGTALPDKIKLVVRDSNKYVAATVIGEAEVDLRQQWEKGTPFDNTVELTHKAKPAGKVALQISCLFETISEKASS